MSLSVRLSSLLLTVVCVLSNLTWSSSPAFGFSSAVDLESPMSTVIFDHELPTTMHDEHQ